MSSATRIRPATSDDQKAIFTWRNDPWLMSFSTSRRKVNWDEHVAWFAKSLAREDSAIFVIETPEGEGVGSVRLERDDVSTATISVYVVRSRAGSGLGTGAIAAACDEGFARWPIIAVKAYIRADNRRSVRAFEKCGFRSADGGPDVPPDHVKLVLSRERDA